MTRSDDKASGLVVAPHVRDAVVAGRPVVGLESSIISHGMPWPRNVEVARDVERLVRDHGAVPATTGVIDGVPHVGLSDDQIDVLGRRVGPPGADVRKASVRDLPLLIAAGHHGATTVAATVRLAHLAGIDVVVTGGIGGVHRGATTTMDVSADLVELGRTPVAVVCAGIKSILDLGLTLEVLETQGVPVVVLDADELPAFYSRRSGLPAPATARDEAEVARAIDAARTLGLGQGMVVAVPPPVPLEVPRERMDAVIATALQELDDLDMTGPATTPWLLARIVELTDGDSLDANVALVRHNAVVGAAIAVQLAARRQRRRA